MKREAIYLDTSSFYYYAYTLYKHILHERSADVDDDIIPDMSQWLWEAGGESNGHFYAKNFSILVSHSTDLNIWESPDNEPRLDLIASF